MQAQVSTSAGKADTFREGVELAASLIDGGQAKQKLEDFIKESNK